MSDSDSHGDELEMNLSQGMRERMAVNTTKAGMSGAKSNVNDVVYDMSKGSRFYLNEERKEKKLLEKIQKFRDIASRFQLEDDTSRLRVLDRKLAAMQAQALSSETRTFVHIDMDQFYAAVEIRDNPSLADKPIGIGGMGMLGTSNYVARKFGVRAGMPGFIGKELCPELIFVAPNFEKYQEASKQIEGIFADFDPAYEMCSLDEAYLDITTFMEEHPSMTADIICDSIRARVLGQTQLTCSGGIGSNRLIAKLAGEVNKPNGQFAVIGREAAIKFIRMIEIRKVPGIGKVSAQLLHAIGMETVADLHAQRALLEILFTPATFDFFMRVTLGIGRSGIHVDRERKSISVERTVAPIGTAPELNALLWRLCEKLALRMSKEGIRAKSLSLKLKSVSFEVISRDRKCSQPLSEAEAMFDVLSAVLMHELPINIRLMGVRASSLVECGDISGKNMTGRPKDLRAYFGSSALAPTREEDANGAPAPLPLPCPPSKEENSTSKVRQFYDCVVCNAFKTDDIATLNGHLDICLARQEQSNTRTPSTRTSSAAIESKPAPAKKKQKQGNQPISPSLMPFMQRKL